MYLLILSLAAVVGAVYYLVGLWCEKKNVNQILLNTAVLFATLALAIISSCLLSQLIYVKMPVNPFIRYEYFVTLVIFYILIVPLQDLKIRQTKFNPNLKLIAQSLIIFSFFSRFGCLIEGCCSGKTINVFTVPIVYLEMLFALVIFIVLKLKKPDNPFKIYVLSYSSFRFITEFFRLNIMVKVYLSLNLRQILALIVLIYLLIEGVITYAVNKKT